MNQTDMRTIVLTAGEQRLLRDWWQAMESTHPVVQHLCSLASELRLHPEASYADGMLLLYRAISEIAYGHSGTRGGIRRTFSGEYNSQVQVNLVMCLGGARQFSDDTKILLERVAKEVTGTDAQRLINRLRETLRENDEGLREIFKKAKAFYGPERFEAIQRHIMRSISLRVPNGM